MLIENAGQLNLEGILPAEQQKTHGCGKVWFQNTWHTVN